MPNSVLSGAPNSSILHGHRPEVSEGLTMRCRAGPVHWLPGEGGSVCALFDCIAYPERICPSQQQGWQHVQLEGGWGL